MARENLWEALTNAFPKTSQKLRVCRMGCWGDGICATKKSVLWGKVKCLMSEDDLENVDLIRRYVDTDVVGGNEL